MRVFLVYVRLVYVGTTELSMFQVWISGGKRRGKGFCQFGVNFDHFCNFQTCGPT